MNTLNVCIVFMARLLLVLLFLPFSALDKLLNFRGAVGQAREAVTQPGLATGLILIGLSVEVLMSGAILSGFADRMAGFIMAGYCIVTALLWKQFWKSADFRLRGPSKGREIFWDFLKNLAVAGGFLMVTLDVTAGGVQTFLDHPLSSTHPYAPALPGSASP